MPEQNNFKFYDDQDVYGTLFFQFPKVLMYGEQYRHLSNDAKLAYMVLKDRLEYSLRNHWVDENNHVYFIFTNQELASLCNCHSQKVTKIKKELEAANLLHQKTMHYNPKTGKNEPNRLYLSKLDVTATDIYLRGNSDPKTPQTLGTSESVKNTPSQKTVETLGTSESVKITPSQKTVGNQPQTLGTSESVKITHDLEEEPKDLETRRYNKETQTLDFSTSKFSQAEIENQNRDLVQNAADFYADPTTGGLFLEKEAIRLISFWVRTPAQMRRFMGIILNAKKDVEKDHQDIGVYIALDDPELQKLMTKTLRRYFNAIRSDEKRIKNPENYLYGAIQNLFGVWWNKQAAREYAAKHPEEQNTYNGRSWY